MQSFAIVACLACVGLVASSTVGVLNVCKEFSWPTGVYPHPSDCAQFIQCSNGITAELDCPNGTVFNPVTRVCDDVANVPVCQGTGSVIDMTDACNLYSWSNGIHYHPYDCTMYIQCTFGRTTIMPCAPGLYFNPAVETCDRPNFNPYLNNCQQYITQFTAAPSAAVVPSSMIYPAGWDTYCKDNALVTGIHPDPYSCLHFIECTFGRTTHMACPAGTAFNTNLMVCDDNSNVNCTVALPAVGK